MPPDGLQQHQSFDDVNICHCHYFSQNLFDFEQGLQHSSLQYDQGSYRDVDVPRHAFNFNYRNWHHHW